MSRAAPPSVFRPYSQERGLESTTSDIAYCPHCAERGEKTALAFTVDAIGRTRSRCPKCDRVAPSREPHPDEILIPQTMVGAAKLLPPCPPGTLRCQQCARPVAGRERFCKRCQEMGRESERTSRNYQPKVCAWPDCNEVFRPTGPRSLHCERHR